MTPLFSRPAAGLQSRTRGPRLRRRAAAVLALSAVALTALRPPSAAADSALLESVKQNPQKARTLCAELKALNRQGLSYTSPQAVAQIATRENLNPMDAEILSTYVVGLYCPDVR